MHLVVASIRFDVRLSLVFFTVDVWVLFIDRVRYCAWWDQFRRHLLKILEIMLRNLLLFISQITDSAYQWTSEVLVILDKLLLIIPANSTDSAHSCYILFAIFSDYIILIYLIMLLQLLVILVLWILVKVVLIRIANLVFRWLIHLIVLLIFVAISLLIITFGKSVFWKLFSGCLVQVFAVA